MAVEFLSDKEKQGKWSHLFLKGFLNVRDQGALLETGGFNPSLSISYLTNPS